VEDAERVGTALKAAAEAKLAAYERGGLMMNPFCVPNPGMAIRMQTDKGVREYLVCLECGHLAIAGAGRKAELFGIAKPALEQVYDAYLRGEVRIGERVN
jgi:hypothetical protein